MSQPNLALRNNLGGFPRTERWLLSQVFKAIGPAPIRLAFKDGEEMVPPGVIPRATILIRDRQALIGLMLDPEMAFGEAYADGRIDVEGDLAEALEAVYKSWPTGAGSTRYQRLTSKWIDRSQTNTLDGSRNNIHLHYDLGNDFYRLWLDEQLVYTCAYFPTPSATLETAQAAKLDYVCRKLQLKPGERVVEAGCGWGALALHMARYYGVSVKAFNISHEQISYARRRAAAAGLSDKVEFVEDDWRNISGNFDAFASVGMLEHVGVQNFAHLGDVIHRSIGESGRGLLHFIGKSHKGVFSRWIRKRIFPGAYAPTLDEALNVLQPHNYAVLDVENLRQHYARTLEHWLERFNKSCQQVSAMYDPWFERAWRLYLAGSIAAFRAGTLQIFQISFAGPTRQPIPWTRAPLYTATEDSKWTNATS
ncbi:MAG: cyclopropane-fatty-acyl-phospholipid synthase family protein [Acidobacteriota bacterium]|nr:cyclopropane-fatty-acyl-phospholipid synthase family protein [Acidobacteriota bacterium]